MDTSSRLGQLLLSGWQMMADSCPTCQTPLMRDRTTQETLCVNCQSQEQRQPNGPPPVHEIPSVAVAGMGAVSEAQQDVDSQADPRLGPYARQTSRLPRALAPNGHASLGEASSDDDTAAGTGAGARAEESPPAAGAHVSSEALLQPPPQRLLPSRAAADPAAEDASERLAAMMLEGWTLMGIHCPRCLQPLVRNRQGELYCCGCKLPVLMEAPQPSAARQLQSPFPGSEASASGGGHARLNGRPSLARGTPLVAGSEAGQAGAQTHAGMGRVSQTQPVPGQPGRNSAAGGPRHTQTLPPHGQAGAAPTPLLGDARPAAPSHAQAQPSPQAGSSHAAQLQARNAAQRAAAAAGDALQPSSVCNRMIVENVWQSLLNKMAEMGHTVESTPVQEADKLRQHASTIGHMAVMLMPLAKLHAEISK